MFDAYNELKAHPTANKLIGSDFMILEYKCPIDEDTLQLLLQQHFITYVISGKKDWITSNKTFAVKEGDAMFVRKGVYTTRQYFEVDHCILTFFMHDDFIRNFIRENSELCSSANEPVQDQIFPLEVDTVLQSLFQSIYAYMKMGKDIPRNLVEIKFKELLFNVILNQKHERLSQFFTSLNQTSQANLDDIMLKNFQHDLQLDEFARLCGRSLSAFKRDFEKVYHQTPGKWLNDKRLEYASALLLSSDMNVNEICYESGFTNSSHFNKVFKDKYQVPPKQFRLLRKNVQHAVR